MTAEQTSLRRQSGAALLIVLLLVATLSFIVMSISDRMTLASSRAANARVRAELLWRAAGVEALAAGAIEAAVKTAGFKFALENPFFAKASEIPMDGGGALIAFKDATVCFNVNSLARRDARQGSAQADPKLAELERLFSLLDLEDDDPRRLAAVIADWIDADNFETPQGAEDGYYSSLPAPYRTGGGSIADLSELRAAADVTAEVYRQIRPYLCALPGADPAPLNINMATKDAAPLLAALLGDDVPLAAVEAAMENRPAGGYASIDQFWAGAAFAGRVISEEARGRVKLKSQYIEADAAVRFHDQRVAVRLVFEVSEDGDARLLSRRLGPVFE
ncbi:MAG: type II secretion system minor pseudopilin GspK [Parvularculaceae bacterium]|jgi:general secretion pathway protein K|nr:type II secretion system minor pseudopilin GspK [Parvularculaceae bacterium]